MKVSILGVINVLIHSNNDFFKMRVVRGLENHANNPGDSILIFGYVILEQIPQVVNSHFLRVSKPIPRYRFYNIGTRDFGKKFQNRKIK